MCRTRSLIVVIGLAFGLGPSSDFAAEVKILARDLAGVTGYPYQGRTVRAFFAGGNGGQIVMGHPRARAGDCLLRRELQRPRYLRAPTRLRAQRHPSRSEPARRPVGGPLRGRAGRRPQTAALPRRQRFRITACGRFFVRPLRG